MHRATGIERERAQEALSTAGKILGSGGLKSTGIVPSGDAKVEIIDEARKWEADLVVVGAQGRSAIDRFLHGSVSEAVAIHANCSVEVIHDRHSPFRGRNRLAERELGSETLDCEPNPGEAAGTIGATLRV